MNTEITLRRIKNNRKSTLGRMNVFGTRVWTLEDPYQAVKEQGNTRIPTGRYELKLRNEGSMTQRYAARFPDMHKGMIWLQNVPDFTYVYIHIGNTHHDTEGCILVGTGHSETMIHESKRAYELIYPKIVEAIHQGRCYLEITDEPT